MGLSSVPHRRRSFFYLYFCQLFWNKMIYSGRPFLLLDVAAAVIGSYNGLLSDFFIIYWYNCVSVDKMMNIYVIQHCCLLMITCVENNFVSLVFSNMRCIYMVCMYVKRVFWVVHWWLGISYELWPIFTHFGFEIHYYSYHLGSHCDVIDIFLHDIASNVHFFLSFRISLFSFISIYLF